MKTKLTLSIDESLVSQGKRYAHSQGQSLSGLVEEALQKLAGPTEVPFSQRWRGKFSPARKTSRRYNDLARRHL